MMRDTPNNAYECPSCGARQHDIRASDCMKCGTMTRRSDVAHTMDEVGRSIQLMRKRYDSGQFDLPHSACRLSLPAAELLWGALADD